MNLLIIQRIILFERRPPIQSFRRDSNPTDGIEEFVRQLVVISDPPHHQLVVADPQEALVVEDRDVHPGYRDHLLAHEKMFVSWWGNL